MRTVQMTLDEELVEKIDIVVKQMKTTRSAFTRDALNAAIKQHDIALLEQKHRKGYESNPIANAEFSVWEAEQDWGDI